MSGARFHSEDGSEDTGAAPVCGHNGSLLPYRHQEHKGTRPTAEQAARLAAIRAKYAAQAAERPKR